METREQAIALAKKLAYELRASGVIILSFSDGGFGMASYGMTRAKCNAARIVVDRIADMIERGDIEIPEELS